MKKKLSITSKIAIWYTLFLLIVAMGLLIAMFNVEKTNLSRAAKVTLMNVVDDAAEEIKGLGEDFIFENNINFYDDGVYVSIYDESMHLLEGKRPGELATLPAFKDGRLRKMRDDEGTLWYIYDSQISIGDTDVWIRGIGKSPIEQSMVSVVTRYLFIVLPILIIIAVTGGFIISRKAFAPVRKTISTVKNITDDGDLSRRVEVADNRGDEIQHLALSFNEMFDKLERTFEAEKQFTSDVSHELRTPLAVIKSQSEYAIENPDFSEQALKTILGETERMSAMVNRLLMLARSESGRLAVEFERIDLSTLCEGVVEQQRLVTDKTILTDIEKDVSVKGDEGILIRILLNLIDNAIKHGGDNIVLELKSAEGFACCSVKDDGEGIPADVQDRIWDRFYCVDRSSAKSSSGLGLSMVKALVELHDGDVSAASNSENGTVFTVRLPL
ncbi:MAG: sensor histidine kinase [Lentihominibacter sp.]|jgi:signal transduction histidine kinase